MFEVGSCSEGFPRLESVLRLYKRAAAVGDSHLQAYPVRQVLDAATRAISQDQSISDCDGKRCLRCHDSIAGDAPSIPPTIGIGIAE